MIVCYAAGDGLGHLTRLRSVLHTLRPAGPVTVVTGSPFADDPRVTGGWRVVETADLTALAPDELIVDAFPAGLKGELTVPSGVRTTHLARLLRWDAYRPLLPAKPPHFHRTFVLEELDEAHHAYLREVSDEILPLTLTDPPSEPVDVDGWLIVHSGPDAETLELVAYAQDMASAERVRPPMTLSRPTGRTVCPQTSRTWTSTPPTRQAPTSNGSSPRPGSTPSASTRPGGNGTG